MMLKQKYSREDFLEFQKQLLPDFKKDIRRVTSSGLKVTENVVLLGQSEQLDLHVFEFTHRSTSDARVSLAADGFRVMKDHAISQALAVYQSESSDDWRLSLMTATLDINPKGRVTQTFSNPKRYSFFLGPEARIHTPEEFLIKKGRVKDAQDLVSRFDVEIVTKEFFQRYKTLFENLQKFLIKDHAFTMFAEKNSIDVDSFAKKILGQIVFCYFLQKKGWLGATKGEDINKGDKDFMRSLFNHCSEKKENFYNDYLEHLFYDSLNAAPEEKGDFFRDYLGCQIPFLNGGLFEPLENYDWKKSFLHIPDSIFSNKQGEGILDVFDLYNFTVFEDDPVDREVSVDPEMLGKVFENLLPENIRKGQGAFYTPREIVHYMCQESLINHLVTEAGVDEKNIRKLVTSKEHLFTSEEGLVFSPAEAEKLDKTLADVKVCDPACGSGAFLVGMLHEIVMARRVLNPKKHEYRLKKDAIQDSIYGVDIDPGAVEIAKLRLWLSLVVDYELEDIEPLPNLDYKIMCGNSLLEELIVGDETIKLFDERLLYVGKKKSKNALSDENDMPVSNVSSRGEALQQILKEKQREMVDLNNRGKLTPQIKQKLDKEIEEILKELSPKRKKKSLDCSPGLFAEKAEEYFDQLRELHKRYFSESDSEAKKKIRRQIEQIELEFIKGSIQEKIDNIESQIKSLNMNASDQRKKNADLVQRKLEYSGIPDMIKKSKSKPYFLWKLNFFEIFQEGGFNLIIGNPPYNAELTEDERLYYKNKYEAVSSGRQDTAAIFVELAARIARARATINFILPYRLFSRKRNHGQFQLWILDKHAIKEIIYAGAHCGFTASDEFMLLLLSVGKNHQSSFIDVAIKPSLEAGRLNIVFSKVDQELFRGLGEINLSLLKYDPNLLKKITNETMMLELICNVRDGIVPYIREKMLSEKKIDKRYVPFAGIAGKYVLQKYFFSREELYLCYDIEEAKKYIKDPVELRKVQLRERGIFLSRKIITAQNSALLKGTIDENQIYVSNSIHSTYLRPEWEKKVSLEYILGLINSSLLNFYHNSMRVKATDLHPQILVTNLKKLPIKFAAPKEHSAVVDLVQGIIKRKKDNPEADTRQLEEQIDKIVYDLYALTNDEIQVVEESKKVN